MTKDWRIGLTKMVDDIEASVTEHIEAAAALSAIGWVAGRKENDGVWRTPIPKAFERILKQDGVIQFSWMHAGTRFAVLVEPTE